MKSSSDTTIGRIALALAVVAVIGLASITLFYALFAGSGGPFGTLNDICVALGGLLSGALVWQLYPLHRQHAPLPSRFALARGLLGACLAPLGSAMAIFDVTGWFLAGLVTTFGYALIGLWLLGISYSARGWPASPGVSPCSGWRPAGLPPLVSWLVQALLPALMPRTQLHGSYLLPSTLAVWVGTSSTPSGASGWAVHCYRRD